MGLKQQRIQSPVVAMICRTTIVCLLLLSGLNAEIATTAEDLESTSNTVFDPVTTHLESSKPPTTKESASTVTPSVAVTTTFMSHNKTELSNQTTISDIDGTTVVTTAKISPTTVKIETTSNSTTVNNLTNATNSTSLPTKTSLPGTSIEATIPAVVSAEAPTTNLNEHSSGPVESRTDTMTTSKQIVTVTTPIGSSTSESTKTSSGDVISSSKPSTQGTTQLLITLSTPVESGTTTGGTESTVPVSKSQESPQKETAVNTASTESSTGLQKALSTGSVAAITVIVIVLVLLIFGGAAFWKIRHSSYGRLLEDQDYGSLGNYNNPLYDDS
ncbi:prostate androgen-regulated mucin-like protein 1 [Mixophyes fleayi]|uniref:prostate androgen-regulated mucin-like protein 1 n=1 Tax=Mixophyes fleayi TaxID=3061075 RepID=UPI003F4E0D48